MCGSLGAYGEGNNSSTGCVVLLITAAIIGTITIILIVIRPGSQSPYKVAVCQTCWRTICHNMFTNVIRVVFVTRCYYSYPLAIVQDLPLNVVYEDDQVLVVNKVTPPTTTHIPCFDLSPAIKFLMVSCVLLVCRFISLLVCTSCLHS